MIKLKFRILVACLACCCIALVFASMQEKKRPKFYTTKDKAAAATFDVGLMTFNGYEPVTVLPPPGPDPLDPTILGPEETRVFPPKEVEVMLESNVEREASIKLRMDIFILAIDPVTQKPYLTKKDVTDYAYFGPGDDLFEFKIFKKAKKPRGQHIPEVTYTGKTGVILRFVVTAIESSGTQRPDSGVFWGDEEL